MGKTPKIFGTLGFGSVPIFLVSKNWMFTGLSSMLWMSLPSNKLHLPPAHFLPPIFLGNKQPTFTNALHNSNFWVLSWPKKGDFRTIMIHTCVALRPCRPSLISSSKWTLQRPPNCNFSVRNCIRDPNNSRKVLTYYFFFFS